MLAKLKTVGPGAMVAAAFIGPGTVVTATKAGGSFGYTLLWAVLFSVIACLTLQEMAARLGVVGNNGLGEAIRAKTQHSVARVVGTVLVLGAILIGNAAYEAGNITGAAMGLEVISPSAAALTVNPIVIVVGIVAFLLLISGRFTLIERVLVGLVCVMGLVFFVSAILLQPDWQQLLRGLFLPRVSDAGWTTVVGIIGTTVVPYNLFLHASAAKQKWRSGASSVTEAKTTTDGLAAARLDTFLSVTLGGMITGAILVAAAAAAQTQSVDQLDSPAALSASLDVVFGDWAALFLSVGFLAAGLSSAITAPLAAAYATSEVLGWQAKLGDRRFTLVWCAILIFGVSLACLGRKPSSLILLAQIANGLLLPIVAVFLVWVMNDRQLMGQSANRWRSNLAGGIVILATVLIGLRILLSTGLFAFS